LANGFLEGWIFDPLFVHLEVISKVYKNRQSCKRFTELISETIMNGGRNSLGEVEPPYIILPITVEPSKPRLCIAARLSISGPDKHSGEDRETLGTVSVYRCLLVSLDRCYPLPTGRFDARGLLGTQFGEGEKLNTKTWAVAKVLESLPMGIWDCRLDVQVDNQTVIHTWGVFIFRLVTQRNLLLELLYVLSSSNPADWFSGVLSKADSILSGTEMLHWEAIERGFGGSFVHILVHLMFLDSNAGPPG